MKINTIKEVLLGEIGAGILLIIIQFAIGFNFEGHIMYILGSNFVALFGIASIIDGIRKLKKKSTKK